MPVRIQRKRTRGWRMPPNTIYVGRPTKWGNSYTSAEHGRGIAVRKYRWRLECMAAIGQLDLSELRGRDLCCWCPLDRECHADVLLEMANR